MKKIGIIIQARINSTRLPNKVMLKLAGEPILWHVVERCKKSNVEEVIIATSTNSENDIIEEFCKKNNYLCFRGSENNVLKRYYDAAKKFNLDTIIRITGDCPLISPKIINKLIEKFRKDKVDYLSNATKRTFPRGLDCEIFSFDTLEKVHNLAKELPHREHVTAFIYGNPSLFKISELIAEGELKNLNKPEIRICIDTPKDLKLLKEIYKNLYKNELILIEEVIRFLENNPKLKHLNMDSEKEQINQNVIEGIKQEIIK